MRTLLVAALLAATWSGVPPGLSAQAARPACAADSVYHQLDFWKGEWNVLVGDQPAGRDRIETILDGCAIIEHWTSSQGNEGKSLFYVDPTYGRWEQVWVTAQPGAIKQKHVIARYADGGIRFQGEVLSPRGRVLDRTTLTPGPDGSVHQLIEVSTDGGTTWRTTFDARYVRIAPEGQD